MLQKFIVVALLSVWSVQTVAKELAIIFDDSPRFAHGYFNAYITLKNWDWFIESLFQEAIKDGVTIDMQRMSSFYVQTLMESINHYDQMAVRHLGRSPKHVLLLHEMDISALFIGDVVDELRQSGWNIISIEQAYADDIANYQS